ncbi:MAG TPA: esterase, partial [Pirellulaceae bacterium]|nr:esterase [Pirellulaceae bacterium]
MRCFPLLILFGASVVAAQPPQARIAASHGYDKAVELMRGNARAVLCPEIGGRVLEFSVGGKQAMWFDEAERTRQPGGPAPSSAGRFDFGPEMTTPRHMLIWGGAWTAEITGPSSARLTSQKDASSGVQLMRDFELAESKAATSGRGPQIRLICKQTITN